jgi:AcrR family transcriptional regulator
VVEPAIANWWKKHETATDLAKMKLIWLVGERLGTSITSAVDPKAASAAFVEGAIAIVPDQQSVKVTPFDQAALPKVSNPTVAAESVESQLVQAAVDVIATSGVAAASMARIARKAQVSTGTIYPRFENLTDLVDASFELSVSNVIEQNFTLLGRTNFEPEDFGLFIMAGLGKPRTNWRNFRVEIHLEGRLRASLKQRITQNLQEANARVSEKLIQYKFPALIAGPIPYLVHTVGIGFAILQNAGLNLLALDHRVMAKEVVQAISKIHP